MRPEKSSGYTHAVFGANRFPCSTENLGGRRTSKLTFLW